jgi:hypothetical protein
MDRRGLVMADTPGGAPSRRGRQDGASPAASLSVVYRVYAAYRPRWRFLPPGVPIDPGHDGVRLSSATIVVLRRAERVFVDAAGVCRDVVGREVAARRIATDSTEAG